MTMTRRLFSMFLPAAPAVVGEVGRGVADKVAGSTSFNPVPPTPFNTVGMLSSAFERPATYAKYQEIEQGLYTAQRFRQRRNYIMMGQERRDPNIMTLKSVSPQHKAMMHVLQEEREQAANRSFLERLADELGLTEFFKKQREEYGGSPIAPNGW